MSKHDDCVGNDIPMATVKVKLYASLGSHFPGVTVGTPVPVEVAADTSVAGLASSLGIDATTVKICFVNGIQRDLGWRLVDGDDVAFFPPIGGGSPRNRLT